MPRRRRAASSGPRRRLPSPRDVVDAALREDRAREDLTTRLVVPNRLPARAVVSAQAHGVLAGIRPAVRCARASGITVDALRPEGSRLSPGTVVLRLSGDARRILRAERTMLNFLMHLSGVATLTARVVRAVRTSGVPHPPKVLATRKTTPGLRDLEKAAVVSGGGGAHRRDLASAVLVKNNHLALVPLESAVRRARQGVGRADPVQVEVRSLAEARVAVRAGADALLLDNLAPAEARRVVRCLRKEFRRSTPFLELSGGISLENVGRYARTGADALSVGALTHSAPAVPFHLTLRRRRNSARAP